MKFFVAVTNNDWFHFLSKIQPDEINFWRPGRQPFSALEVGQPFLFKLHYPSNFIVGGGFFIRYELLPLSLAWEAFGKKNGVPDIFTFRSVIQKLAQTTDINPFIGCIILNEPFFFSREQWIEAPPDFSRNIMSGKTYNTTSIIGQRWWNMVQQNLVHHFAEDRVADQRPDYGIEKRYGSEYLMKARLGQGAFRILVTSAYHRRCAISGEKALPVLEASHIKPFSCSGPNRIDNGLLLRSDIHKLFDAGYLTISTDYRVEVSRRIKEDFENGGNYYTYHGKNLFVLPDADQERPNHQFLEWHNSEVYLG